jgi:hypothetical protein
MVEIVVLDPNGTRISNADLCLAMPGQNARKMTDSNGSYKTTLPVGTTTIRVFKSGYANAQDTVPMTKGANLVRFIQLQPGQATPLPSDCGSITATTIPGNSCDVMTKFAVDGPTTTTNRQVTLLLEFASPPDSYRITEFSAAERYPEYQFRSDVAFNKKNVSWVRHVHGGVSLTTFFTLTEPHYGTHSIYIQTRRFPSGCISSPRVVSVILAPARMQTYVLSGQTLAAFEAAARNRGYQSTEPTFEIVRSSGDCPPGTLSYAGLGAKRTSNYVYEDVRAGYEVFIGPDLNPYWKLKGIEADHSGLRLPIVWGTTYPPMQLEMSMSGPPPGSMASSPRRYLGWRRLLFSIPHEQVECSPIPDPSQGYRPFLVRVELEGPAGEDPINALPSLRQRPVSDLPPTFQPPKGDPLPKVILPRGVDEKDGTERGQDEDPSNETEKQP